MGEITVHFDKEWEDGMPRMDYQWEKNGQTYTMKDIPCKKWPLGCDDYLEDAVAFAVDMLLNLQEKGEFPETIVFDDYLDEELLGELSRLLQD